MTREAFARMLSGIEQALDGRVEIWRDIIDRDGTVVGRIYRGPFKASPDSHVGEPQRKGEQ